MSSGEPLHLMVDLETLGKAPRGAVISIGAVLFDPLAPDWEGPTFYERIDFASACHFGETDGDTIAWWFRQSEAARAEFIPQYGEDPWPPLPAVLTRLSNFYLDVCGGRKIPIWGNGPTFDVAILENAYSATGLKAPWEFRAVRDCRTIKHICEDRMPLAARPKDTPHNALHDAKWQARWVAERWSAIASALAVPGGVGIDLDAALHLIAQAKLHANVGSDTIAADIIAQLERTVRGQPA